MWETTGVCWHGIHPDVNILVGINGRGKTTLLNAINDYYNDALHIGRMMKKYILRSVAKEDEKILSE